MTTVYIAGPYTGDGKEETIEYNVFVAVTVANHFMDLGFTVLNPFLCHYHHELYQRDYNNWLHQDLELLAKADIIIRLPGESNGAEQEVHKATMRGMPIHFLTNDIVQDIIKLQQERINAKRNIAD